MNQKERVISAIAHKKTDIIPYQLDLTQGSFHTLSEHYGNDCFLYSYVGNHLIREKNKNHTFIDKKTFVDIFGVTWRLDQEGGDIGNVKGCIFTQPDIKLFDFPEPNAELIKRKCESMINEHPDVFKIYEIGFSLFERAWTLRGMENLLMDFILEEDFTNDLLDRILEYNLKVIDIAAKYPIDCILFGDDWGQQKGLIMGPAFWRKYIKPRVRAMYEATKKHNLYVAQHSCGDNSELFADLIEIGLDIYNTFQPEVYDVDKITKEYGKDITIYGGVSTQVVLAKGSPDDVRRETERMMGILGRNGGYIVAPTHQITTDTPLENMLAFIETIKNQ